MSNNSDLLGMIGGSAAEKAQKTALIESLKKGKSAEQKRCIDFLLADSGCTGKNPSGLKVDDYQKLVLQKCASLKIYGRALNKIGLDESQIKEIDPIVLQSYRFDDDCYVKIEDGKAVSSQFSVSIIFFSTEQIYTYTYIFEMIGNNSWEFTKDYFYTDITSICTGRVVKEKIDDITSGCLKPKHSLEKSSFVIDTLTITVPGAKDEFSMRNSSTMEKSIQAAKAMIREKKYAR